MFYIWSVVRGASSEAKLSLFWNSSSKKSQLQDSTCWVQLPGRAYIPEGEGTRWKIEFKPLKKI